MQEKNARKPNSVRSEEMRARLIASARALFVEKGFAETGTPEIVRAANVTRGALYHHFADKTDLFWAVALADAEAVEAEIEAAATASTTPEEAMRDGADAFFAAMARPGRARLLLIEGLAVLGTAEMDRILAGSGRASLEKGLAALRPDLPEAEIKALALALSAAFDRAALAVAEGGDARLYRDTLLRLVGGLAQN